MIQKDRDLQDKISQLAEDLEKCQKLLIALGDENRQHLILSMMSMEECSAGNSL